MKKNLVYLLLLILLGAGAYFFVAKRSSGTLKEKEKAFAVDDTAAVYKVFIADMKGRKVVMGRSKSTWIINDKYEVRSDYIQSLLSTIKRVNTRYPVPEAARKTVVTGMASENKKVEIYDKNGELMKSYIVGGPTLDSKGTYMLMEGSSTPFVVTIPGFQGVLDTRYETDEEKIRSTSIYRFRMNELANVSVQYTGKPDSSFSIRIISADSFEVSNGNGMLLSGTNLDKEHVRQYLQYFEFVNCEAFQNSLAKKDSILQSTPFCTINVTDRQEQQHAVTCYYMPRNLTSEQFDVRGNELQYDIDHYFATINNGKDFVIIQQFHFGKLFKTFHYFITRAKPKNV